MKALKKVAVTVCLIVVGVGIVWWAVEDIKVLVRAWRAGEMPETAWLLTSAGLWWCAIAAVAVVSARTRASRAKAVKVGEGHGNQDEADRRVCDPADSSHRVACAARDARRQ